MSDPQNPASSSSAPPIAPGPPRTADSDAHQRTRERSSSHIVAGMRSRVTVVCSECKRLKLKCDRRTPCGQCEKRNCIAQCKYTPGAQEKVDITSVHNRVITIEARLGLLPQDQMSQIGLASLAPALHTPTDLAGLVPSGSQLHPAHPCCCTHQQPRFATDRALLADGAGGSSLAISLDDITAVWLQDLELRLDGGSNELAPSASGMPPPFLPAVDPYYLVRGALGVTPALVGLLPRAPATRARLMRAAEQALRVHPSFHWFDFERRAQQLFDPETQPGVGVGFFAAAAAVLALGALVVERERAPERAAGGFGEFAAGMHPSAFSLGAGYGGGGFGEFTFSVQQEEESKADVLSPAHGHASPKEADEGWSARSLYALAVHTLAVLELGGAPYDMDGMAAMVVQVVYLLHDTEGRMGVAGAVFPAVGKMVNVARQMGLHMDPDEFPGRYAPFEAEMRRRMWWDVFYYDVFVSDSVGQPPLIADNTHTTRIPVDVDEMAFHRDSDVIPYAEPGPNGEPAENSSAYFGLKCRLAQMVKAVKKGTYRDPADLNADFTIDAAATIEGEIQQFLKDLPPAFQMSVYNVDKASAPAESMDPTLVAQRCELAIVAHALALKLYLPFLKTQPRGRPRPHQALQATLNAAHEIVHASGVLHTVLKRVRPAAFAFYSFRKTLFSAAVVCAHTMIHDANSLIAPIASQDVGKALEILRDPLVAPARDANEAVQVVEMMMKRAEDARNGLLPTTTHFHPGTKRKRSAADDALGAGFQMPYAGPAATVRATSPPPPAPPPLPAPPTSSRASVAPIWDPPAPAPPPTARRSQEVEPAQVQVQSAPVRERVMARPSVSVRSRGKDGTPFQRARQDERLQVRTPDSAGTDEGGGFQRPRVYRPEAREPLPFGEAHAQRQGFEGGGSRPSSVFNGGEAYAGEASPYERPSPRQHAHPHPQPHPQPQPQPPPTQYGYAMAYGQAEYAPPPMMGLGMSPAPARQEEPQYGPAPLQFQQEWSGAQWPPAAQPVQEEYKPFVGQQQTWH